MKPLKLVLPLPTTSGSLNDFTEPLDGHEPLETFDDFMWFDTTHSTHPELQTLDAPLSITDLTKISRVLVPYALPRVLSLTDVQSDERLKEVFGSDYLDEESQEKT